MSMVIGSIQISVITRNARNSAIYARQKQMSTKERIVYEIRNQSGIKHKEIISSYKYHSELWLLTLVLLMVFQCADQKIRGFKILLERFLTLCMKILPRQLVRCVVYCFTFKFEAIFLIYSRQFFILNKTVIVICCTFVFLGSQMLEFIAVEIVQERS